MILPDVNVLIRAFRIDSVEHQLCRKWLERTIAAGASFGISPLALSAVVRITTGRRFYQTPSTAEEAFRFCDFLVAQPHCQVVKPGDRHWEIFKRLGVETNTRGPRVTDAWFAALAIEWGCEWITMDGDFARFPGLTWSAPAA